MKAKFILSISLILIIFNLSAYAQSNYQNFKVSIYTRAYEVQKMEDQHWLDFNKEMSPSGGTDSPVITKVKDPMPTFQEAASYTADEQWSKVSRIPFVAID